MKILHTSDWHIGQKLYGNERYIEHERFLDWLLNYIQNNSIDILLVSGDIFDTSTPSNKALNLYYNFVALCSSVCKRIIITGGNHDSISTLNAAQFPLKHLNVDVIGGATAQISEELIVINDELNSPLLSVAAVPFLRDKDLKSSSNTETSEERIKAIKEGIINHYKELEVLAKNKNVPSIAMGHLFMSGSSTSDSERDIHIGNLGEVTTTNFPKYFDYIALGHIHKPQRLGDNDNFRYSGSPIPLSFSERKDDKQIVIVELSNDKVNFKEIVKVPCYRKLLKVSGTLKEVQGELNLIEDDNDLKPWIEVIINEPEFNSSIITDFEEFKTNFSKGIILKYKVSYEKQAIGADEFFDEGVGIDELSPTEVFEMKIENDDEADLLREAFTEVLESLNQSHEN